MRSDTTAVSAGQAIKAGLGSALENVWAAGFTLAGRGRRPVGGWVTRVQRVPQRVLVVAPHPDDETLGCAGTLLRHAACGDQVAVLHVTDGRQSQAGGLQPAAMADQRRKEAAACAAVLGLARWEWLGLPESGWQPADLCPRLRAFLTDWSPDVVYAPSRIDFHSEHIRVAQVLAEALVGLPPDRPHPRLRVYPVQVPLSPVLANWVVDVSQQSDGILAVLRTYPSQWKSLARSLRARRYTACYYGMARLAEEFWDLSDSAYCRLHLPDQSAQANTRFMGLHFRPWQDPFAYLSGNRARRRLALMGS